jgi:predicted transcriptional regulator
MSKSLVAMATEIATAQANHVPMSAEDMESYIIKTFDTLRDIRFIEETGELPKKPKVEIPVSIEETVAETVAETVEETAAETVAETVEESPEPAWQSSIGEDKVVCLECGVEFKTLNKRHLNSHGLTPEEYKEKHGIPKDQPLTCESLAKERRERAQNMRLERKNATRKNK